MEKKKFFLNKRIYVDVRAPFSTKAAELIKSFGGTVETFLDNEISYLLTDVPKDEWPSNWNGEDTKKECPLQSHQFFLEKRNSQVPDRDPRHRQLEQACNRGTKLISLSDLLSFCAKYVTSNSSSDEDDELKATIKELQQPFLKHEDINYQFAPSTKEFVRWPELNINTSLQVGRSFFSDPSSQVSSPRPVVTSNLSKSSTKNGFLAPVQGVRRRNSVYCEICNLKIVDKIEDHIQTPAHKTNTEKLNWTEVSSVIDSLPSLSTLNMRRLTNLTPPNGIEHQEFLCLHKVESVSQLFFNSNNSIVDKRLVNIL